MTSPFVINPVKTFRFDAMISGEMLPHPEIDCFNGDDIKIIFSPKDENGNAYEVDDAGITAQFLVSDTRSNLQLVALTETSGITLSGATITVDFNLLAVNYQGRFSTQLVLKNAAGKGGVIAFGNIVLTRLINDTERAPDYNY